MVLLVIAFMLAQIAAVPFMPRFAAAVEPTKFSPSSAPVQEEVIDKAIETLGNPELMAEKVAPALDNYMKTGEIADDFALSSKGEVQVLIYLDPSAKMKEIRANAEIIWNFDARLLKVVYAKVSSPAKCKDLSEVAGVLYLSADTLITRPYEKVSPGVSDEPFNFKMQEVVGATDVIATDGYDGSDVIVGYYDSAVDFSQPDMQDAMAVDDDGFPLSYDPSGWGIELMTLANNTAVDNVTAWLEAGYLLTYEMEGKYYLNVTGWDPVVSDTAYTIDNMFGYYWDVYEYYLAGGFRQNLTEFTYGVLWQDWEIPAPTANNYTTGWLYQRRGSDYGFRRFWSPALMLDNERLIFDFNGSKAFSTMHNGWRYGAPREINLNLTADRDYIEGMMDWSFVDDFDDGYVFEVDGNNVIAADTDNDGEDDWGFGAFCWSHDQIGYFDSWFNVTLPGTDEEELFCGIRGDGLGYALLFPVDISHGHWTGAAVASRGVVEHDVYNDEDNLQTLPGVAPGSKIISVGGYSGGSTTGGQFWGAGFHLAPDGNWTYTGEHKAHIHSNSWGYSWGSYVEQTYLGLVWDCMAVPGYIDESNPGTLFLFSAGNEGPGYMTTGPPTTSPAVVSVGGTWINHRYEEEGWYGPELSYNQEAPSASKGPSYLGLVKPDVLAPYAFGANPNPFQIPIFGDLSYHWWSGTSLACPIAAGVAAIILDAIWDEWGDAEWYDPLVLAEILQSSADDIGYDPFYQGNGFVNAKAAVEALKTSGDELYFHNVDSYNNWALIMNETWHSRWGFYNGSSPIGGIWVDESLDYPPTDYGMTNLFFGNLYGGDSATVEMTAYDYDGSAVALGDLDGATPWYYTMKNMTSFDVMTYMYNDTNQYMYNSTLGNPQYGTFNLSMYMDDIFAGQFWDAPMVTVAAHDAAGAVAGGIRLFDWNDTVDDGVMNYYNSTEDNDFVKLLTRCDNNFNQQYVKVADPDGMDDLFEYWPLLQVYDSGHTVSITLVLWEKTMDTKVDITADGDDIDVTLTLPADVEPGIHAGFIKIENGAFTHELPYSYMAGYELDGDVGTDEVVIDGFGDEIEAFDNGLVHPCVSATDYPDYGQRNILLNIPDDYPTKNRTVLVAKVEWENEGTAVDLYIKPTGDSFFSQYVGTDEATFYPNEDTQNTIIYDFGGLMNGTYNLHYECSSWAGVDFWENVTITLQWYNVSLPAAEVDTVWWSRWDTDQVLFSDGETLVGDHVEILANWTLGSIGTLPEYAITRVNLEYLSGMYYESDWMDLVIPTTNPDDFFNGVGGLLDQLSMHVVKGFAVGDPVTATMDFTNGDCDFMAWPGDVDSGSYSYSNNLFGSQAASSAHPEVATFTWESANDTMVVVALDYDQQPGEWNIIVDTRSSIPFPETGSEVSHDTYDFLLNISKDIRLTAYTDTNVFWQVEVTGLTFQNFFSPNVEVLTPNGGEDWSTGLHNITWMAWDNNSDDIMTYRVQFSQNAGDTWMLLADGLYDTYFEWDPAPFLAGDEWLIRVVATDNDTVYTGMPNPLEPTVTYTTPSGDVFVYPNWIGFDFGAWNQEDWPAFTGSDESDAVFTAGSQTQPTTTTTTPPETTTTTTTTTPEPPATIDPLLIGLIGGIGAGVVVVLILFLVKRK
jgi:hypothetical protein